MARALLTAHVTLSRKLLRFKIKFQILNYKLANKKRSKLHAAVLREKQIDETFASNRELLI
jgi:hypothetical protein